jgi:hypothetical protein
MPDGNFDQDARKIMAMAARNGRTMSLQSAKALSWAADKLKRLPIRPTLPTSIQDCLNLDNKIRYVLSVFCRCFSEYTTLERSLRYKIAAQMLSMAGARAIPTANRPWFRPQTSFRAWSPKYPRGALSTRDWCEKATR